MNILDQITSTGPASVLSDAKTEALLLAACISRPDILVNVMDDMPEFTDAVFSDPVNAKMWQVMAAMVEDDKSINAITVSHAAGVDQGTIQKMLAALAPKDYSSAISYAEVLQDKYMRRTGYQVFSEALTKCSDTETSIAETYDGVNKALSEVFYNQANSTEATMPKAMNRAMEQIVAIRQHALAGGSPVTGYPTGLTEEDKFTGGYQNGNLIIIAARPGMGKTSKVLRTLLEGAKAGRPCGMFSLEMNTEEIITRMLTIETEVDNEKFKTGRFTDEEIDKVADASEALTNMPFYIDDKGGASIGYIKRVATKWKRKHKIQLLVIDHLQLITLTGARRSTNRTEMIGIITRQLKSLSKALKMPILLLSQLNRAVETRGGSKRPQLSDLRDSGDIEQDADIVQFIYRPEYYGIFEDESGDPLHGTAELIMAKHRNGALGTVHVGWKGECFRFHDLVKEETEENNNNYTSREDVRVSTYADTSQDVPF